VKKKITNLKLSCITMPLKVGLTLWTSLWGNTLVQDQQAAGIWNYFSASLLLLVYVHSYCGCWNHNTNFIHISIWKYIWLSMTILCILLYISAGEMKTLNKHGYKNYPVQ
jgi:succinate dehydrogenase hydrophobic anchor subunit